MQNINMKIAVIGSGISGLGAAYLLSPDHDVYVLEKNNYTGGHSRTIDVDPVDHNSKNTTPVDTGFIVFNNWNYPNLLGLFKELDVPYQKSDMSFGVSIQNGWLEYASGGMLAQKRNIFRPAYWKMIIDILRFNKQAPAYIDKDNTITLEQCLDELKMGDWFRNYYLLAMGAAIWSCPLETIMKFPAKTFLQFFKNHGLLSINNRPQWYTVTGGSREYVQRLSRMLRHRVRHDYAVSKVIAKENGFRIEDYRGNGEHFDQVIFACHADEALQMIENPTEAECEVLGSFDYQDNYIVVHSDESFMPQQRKCWASWVYLSEKRNDDSASVSLSYWMNNLQSLVSERTILVTLNPGRRPAEDTIMDEHVFSHPIFDQKAIDAQARISEIQGKRGLWFCGAYQRYGFHEDGLLSAVNVAKQMGSEIPWES